MKRKFRGFPLVLCVVILMACLPSCGSTKLSGKDKIAFQALVDASDHFDNPAAMSLISGFVLVRSGTGMACVKLSFNGGVTSEYYTILIGAQSDCC